MRSSGQRFDAVRPAMTRFSSTLRLPKMRRSSCTSCMPARATAWLLRPARSTPSSFTDPVRGGALLDLVGCAFDQHPAFLQHGDALGELEQRVHVVIDDDHGSVAADRL